MILAEFAGAEYRRRHQAALRKVGGGQIAPAEAEALLRPWLAAALRCGADPGSLHLEVARAVEAYRKANLSDRQARSCAADDLCPLPSIRETVAAARDARLDRDAEDLDRTRGLIALGDALGAPAYRPAARQQAAA